MASQFAPIYPAFYKVYSVSISTANTGLDGTGTIGTLVTAATGGTVVRKVYIKAGVTTTAGTIRFFIYDGSTYRLIKEVNVTAVTPVVGTTPAFEGTWDPGDPTQDALLGLPSGSSLRVSTNNAEQFYVHAEVEEYS